MCIRDRFEDAEERVARAIIENHHDFEPHLKSLLVGGTWVIIEGSMVDSIAWSQVNGISSAEAKQLHTGLTAGDIEILLHENRGRRFLEAKEVGHVNESDETRIKKARSYMRALAKEECFLVERVNFFLEESREEVFEKVLRVIFNKGLLPENVIQNRNRCSVFHTTLSPVDFI